METEDVAELARRAFGEWALRKVAPEWAAARIGHEPTRRLVTELGLPPQGPGFFSLDLHEDQRRPTVRERFEDLAPGSLGTRLCTEFGHYLYLGDFNGEDILLDPESGRLYWFRGPHENVERILVNSGVAEFLTFLARIELHRIVDGRPFEEFREGTDEEYATALRSVLKGVIFGVREVDRAVFPPKGDDDGFESFWYPWLIDHADEDQAFDSWAWNRHSAEYFAARGIHDLATREPRHPVDLALT
ncbi:SUKH-4 family immunity protein [Streptomyces sp. Y1]|uniref:SUKH-4 family immunity protein n=1 Tax=Streptomyces sp. Y1 TaxID=3238634 RepID=A0AB39TTC5_9ACTN